MKKDPHKDLYFLPTLLTCLETIDLDVEEGFVELVEIPLICEIILETYSHSMLNH
jgi:hypothetical protein